MEEKTLIKIMANVTLSLLKSINSKFAMQINKFYILSMLTNDKITIKVVER
jgi:hypothetical protein